jgi:UDP-galactopyranose mutase
MKSTKASLDSLDENSVVIVGAGFYGLTLAERIANELQLKVLVIEKRNHIGGNAHSYIEPKTGIEVHRYGSHLFHTSNRSIWDYVNRFSAFNSYRHFVIARSEGMSYEMPINLQTLSQVYGFTMSPTEAKALIESEKEKSKSVTPENLEEYAISQVGQRVYEKLIKGYTMKQWGKDPLSLPLGIIKRLPVRFNFVRDYFNDKYMGLPIDGYFRVFERMIDNPNIEVLTNTDFFEVRHEIPKSSLLIYSGPVDRFLDYKYGRLEWRTLDFEFENIEESDFQGCAVVNYSDEAIPFTRIHEFKHLHPEREFTNMTSIAKEYSRFAKESDEEYYPIETEDNVSRYALYKKEVSKLDKVIVGGRLGSYKYLDMHMAIGMAFRDFETVKQRLQR